MSFRRPTQAQGVAAMAVHYEREINRICNAIGFKNEMGIRSTEQDVSNNNEKLYELFMKRKNMLDILDRIDSLED